MTLVADEDDLVPLVRESPGLGMNLGDKRAGCVDGLQSALSGLGMDGGRDAMSGEDDGCPLGDLLDLVDENRASGLKGGNDVLVVNDLLADVHRCAVEIERLLD
ncbi:unannotated protein [freshwater metagenome]|uniref:Unannotated protein n=1 Tax=freshwater metagenome TaxID=449393 RepID=A0A6J7N2X8_9ZZZZ